MEYIEGAAIDAHGNGISESRGDLINGDIVEGELDFTRLGANPDDIEH